MKSINNEITLKSLNLAILDEIQTIRKLQYVITYWGVWGAETPQGK